MSLPLDALRDLYRHMEWADAAVWRAVLAHPAAVVDTRLADLLVHLHLVQRAFLQVWKAQPVAFPSRADFSDLAAVRLWSQPVYDEAHRFFDALDPARLVAPVTLPWAAQLAERLGMPPHPPTLGETIFQVTSHSTYHRGQVNARLRETGGEPPLVDFIAWVWFGRPAADTQIHI